MTRQFSIFVWMWTWCKSFIRLIRWSKCKRWWKCKRKQWWNYSRRKIFNNRIIYLSGWRSFAVLSWVRVRIYTERFQGIRGSGSFRSTRQRTWIRQSSWSMQKSLGELWVKYEGRKVNDCGSIDRVAESSQSTHEHFYIRWLCPIYYIDCSTLVVFLLNKWIAEYTFSLFLSSCRCFSRERIKGIGMSGGIGLSGGFRVRKDTRERVIGQSDDTAPDSSDV